MKVDISINSLSVSEKCTESWAAELQMATLSLKIYTKLDIHSRTEALEKAAELGILDMRSKMYE